MYILYINTLNKYQYFYTFQHYIYANYHKMKEVALA